MPRWLNIAVKSFGVLIGLILLVYVLFAVYVTVNNKAVLAAVTKQLNTNFNGSMTIESMNPTFLKGFPGVSLGLKNVIIRDSLWHDHKHNLLEAKNLDVSVNLLGFLEGDIEIEKIGINVSTIYLFTDSNGYSNTSIFKKSKPDNKVPENESAPPEVKRILLNNVNFVVDNRKGHKLFHFVIDEFKGKIDHHLLGGWDAEVKLKAFAKSLAFNTRKGSFIKNKRLDGPFKLSYHDDSGLLDVAPNQLKIGNDRFIIGATFDTSKEDTGFKINISAPNILWKDASMLLTPNITSKLNKFNLSNPIAVKCTLNGHMGPGGDPEINVQTTIKDNVLTTPGGVIKKCNFDGVFTNNYIRGKGFSDPNSAVKLYAFKGTYDDIPFSIDTAFIHNLDAPVASGIFRSEFELSKLNKVVGDETLKFGKGTATVNLAYKAAIVNLQLVKPLVSGNIELKNADIKYIPRNLSFSNTAILLNFTNNDLFIRNIRLQSGKSVVMMDGTVRNFLNLYYTAPEKIILNWQIRSPQIHLGEFLGFLGSRKQAVKAKRKDKSTTTFSEDLNEMFEKSKVNMQLNVAKVYYNKFLATNAKAELTLSESGIEIKNASVKHAGGSLRLNGKVIQKGNINRFYINTVLNKVDVKHFFYAFEDFGLKSLTSKNLSGYLYSRTNLSGGISDRGKLLPNSLSGTLDFNLNNGALKDFEPIMNVGKFAFPFRDLNNITFDNLKGKFQINGQKITIQPMQINSSLLNMDIAGIYSLTTGTNIAIDIPLRNPKKDDDITDREELKLRRMKGIVLHLLATDGEDGKIKIKLNRNREESK